jgi:hypothetical protein
MYDALCIGDGLGLNAALRYTDQLNGSGFVYGGCIKHHAGRKRRAGGHRQEEST